MRWLYGLYDSGIKLYSIVFQSEIMKCDLKKMKCLIRLKFCSKGPRNFLFFLETDTLKYAYKCLYEMCVFSATDCNEFCLLLDVYVFVMDATTKRKQ